MCTQRTPFPVGRETWACLFHLEVDGIPEFKVLKDVLSMGVEMTQGVLRGPEADKLWNLRSEDLGEL